MKTVRKARRGNLPETISSADLRMSAKVVPMCYRLVHRIKCHMITEPLQNQLCALNPHRTTQIKHRSSPMGTQQPIWVPRRIHKLPTMMTTTKPGNGHDTGISCFDRVIVFPSKPVPARVRQTVRAAKHVQAYPSCSISNHPAQQDFTLW